MFKTISIFKNTVYNKLDLRFSTYFEEEESKEYEACRFKLNSLNIISRTSKITPKKTGQFVTCWKRSEAGPISPFDDSDKFDFLTVSLRENHNLGQFVFPREELIKRGIIASKDFEGKRAFRVYPSWATVKSKQAQKTQEWQEAYFYRADETIDFNKVLKLYTVT